MLKKISTKNILGGLLILTTLITGFLLGKAYQKKPLLKYEKHQAGYRYISPLLECENFNPPGHGYKTMQSALEKKIGEYTSSQKAEKVALYFRDLNNGPWISINGEEKFSPASLLKVPLMMAYLKIAENNPQVLEKKLIVEEDESGIFSQNIKPLKMVTPGEEYIVEDLIVRMIKYSDNLAADVLLKNFDPSQLNKIYLDLDIKIPGTEGLENFMSIIDYSVFFRILYNASYLNRDMSEKALQIMTEAGFYRGLINQLPADTIVSHKFGERVVDDKKQLHDCGIVYLKNKNYLICIMTRGQDFSIMENIIADLSKEVFDTINLRE